MEVINIYDAKTHLSKLLARVEQGEEFIIARNGRPVARLIGADTSSVERVPGLDKGELWYAEDFHKPLPLDVTESFE